MRCRDGFFLSLDVGFCPDSHEADIFSSGFCRLLPIGDALKMKLFLRLVEADRLEIAEEVLPAQKDMWAKRSERGAQEQLFPEKENIDPRRIEVLSGRASCGFPFLS